MISLIVLVLLAGATILVVSRLGEHHRGPVAASTSTAATTASTTSDQRPRTTRSSATATTSPARPANPAGQVAARAVSTDIARSVAARNLIGPANKDIAACRATARDPRQLDRAASIRDGLVAALGRLDVRGLSGGSALVARLRTAWTYSARADAAYASWGRRQLGCTGQAKTIGDRDWDRAHHNDVLATAAKTAAVKLWNPLARRYHLPTRTADTI